LDRAQRPQPEPHPREITDARTLRALAHPLRLALIEILWRDESVSAAQAGRELGESQANCSFHLRQLAKFGIVEEVEGSRGRARPWRLSAAGLLFAGVQDDPEAALAWAALERLLRGRQTERYRAWLEGRSGYSARWRAAAFHVNHVAWLTPDELDEIADEVNDLLRRRGGERRGDPARRPADALPVELVSFAYPTRSDTGEH
jgi:DNA-binding transcriptional ArsR family regulator